MRRKLVLCASLLTLTAGSASAAGINLGWDDCPGGSTYALTETFACDTNVGAHTLVGSFVAPAGVLKMSANDIVIEMQTSGAALPDWWELGNGTLGTAGCRPASLSGNFDFTGGPFTCYDYWQGGAIGAIVMDNLAQVGNRTRINGVFAIPAGDLRITSVPEGTHVYSFKANINNAKTVGLGACGGCAAQACIVLQSIKLDQSTPYTPLLLTNSATSQYVIWQAWSNPAGDCPQVTPTRNETWGSIKALYR